MKMLKKYRSILIIAVLLLVFLLSITYQMNGSEKENEQRKRISFIVYGDDSERWENMRQGAGLVCDEYGADISLITMMSDDDAEEQKQIIEEKHLTVLMPSLSPHVTALLSAIMLSPVR